MYFLTGGTMAVLCIQWLLTAQLVANLAAMTASLVAHVEVLRLVVYSVRSAVLPLVELALGGAWVSILTIGGVGGIGHIALSLQIYLVQARDWS